MAIIRAIINLFRFPKKNWKAVLLCLLAATVFWFFNALNKSYSTNLNYPVVISYDETAYVPVSPLPDNVKLNVSGLGWDLLRKSIGLKILPLNIRLENPADVKKIPGPALMALFSPQMEGLQLNLVLTDTLHIQIDPLVTRTIKIVIDSVSQYIRPGYGLSSAVIIQPGEVKLEGPKSVVSSIDRYQLKLPASRIDRNYKDDIELKWDNEFTLSNPPVVHVEFAVERLVQVTDTVKLTYINVPAGLQGKLPKENVSFTYSIPESMVNKTASDAVRAIVDLKSFRQGKHQIVPVIQGLPAFSHLEKVDTLDISF